MRKYKTSYKSKRGVKRFHVDFSTQMKQDHIEKCTMCGGGVEECPMMRGICYSCYRGVVSAEVKKEPVVEFGTDLGTHVIISGGEALELSSVENQNQEIPF